MIETLLAKAHRALATAEQDLANGDPDAAANRCYYAVFYAAWATFVAHGLERPKTHSGLIAEFGQRFVKNGPFGRDIGVTLGSLETLRSHADYTLTPTPSDKAAAALEAARRFLTAIERAIVKTP
jgi:uncharacterized protein (UPF0332 family)